MAVTESRVKPTTTDAGAQVESDEHSLTIGADGPILLQDHYLIEQMANFDQRRQRLHQGRGIPARCPHGYADPVLDRGRGAGQP
jgi:catalase